jgi:hypothetical protein
MAFALDIDVLPQESCVLLTPYTYAGRSWLTERFEDLEQRMHGESVIVQHSEAAIVLDEIEEDGLLAR